MAKRGVTVYAVEAFVWSALAVAWISTRLALSSSPVDQGIMIFAAVLSLCNLVACSVLPDSDAVEDAYFSVIFPLWITYTYIVVELLNADSDSRASMEKAWFGGLFASLAACALSLAFLTIQTLMAAAAIHEKLWSNSAWIDISVVFLTTVQTSLCRQSDAGTAMFSIVFILNFFTILLMVPRLFQLPVPYNEIWGIQVASVVGYASVTLEGASSALTFGIAVSRGTTTWVLPILLAFCMAGLVFRMANGGSTAPPSAEQASGSASSNATSASSASAPASSAAVFPVTFENPLAVRLVCKKSK